MAVINTSDIEARWRPLSDAETTVATTLIDDVEAWAMLAVPSLEGALEAEDVSPYFTQTVKRVLAGAVIRVLKNPQAYRSESDGDYSYSFDRVVSSGELFLSPADLRLLGRRTRHTSVTITDEGLDYIGRWAPAAWSEVES